MIILAIFVLLCLAGGAIESGFLPALFPIGYAIFWLANRKGSGDSIESFSAFMFAFIVIGALVAIGDMLISMVS